MMKHHFTNTLERFLDIMYAQELKIEKLLEDKEVQEFLDVLHPHFKALDALEVWEAETIHNIVEGGKKKLLHLVCSGDGGDVEAQA